MYAICILCMYIYDIRTYISMYIILAGSTSRWSQRCGTTRRTSSDSSSGRHKHRKLISAELKVCTIKHNLAEFDDAIFVMVDAEKYPESRKLATVDNLPTFATFKDGKLVNQIQTNKADVLKLFIDETTNN